uniref:Uncharacterized protein n=1 Tax=Aegilops tauschii subsp. strangulata TaxID=200361 RepID=A0A453LHX0_AEGTS
LHSCGFLFLGFCFLIRDLAFHGSHLCNSRFSRENQIQVGEDHDLGWHGDRLIDFLDLMACAQRIQTGIHKQKGEFVVTFSCRVKKVFTREQ